MCVFMKNTLLFLFWFVITISCCGQDSIRGKYVLLLNSASFNDHWTQTLRTEIKQNLTQDFKDISCYSEELSIPTLQNEKEAEALKSGKMDEFLRLVKESGRSSYMYLQNVVLFSDPDHQPLALALALSEQLLKEDGAWRVHGGGLAGTIQAFVPNSKLDEYCTVMERVFGKGSCHVLSIRPMGAAKVC